ncbi:excinuclease ABC subunit UvrC [Candidatus Peribacteria bacterium]|nr:excinuclease ABC subunit UvrC [Candidatus Peribacteria bacterium]
MVMVMTEAPFHYDRTLIPASPGCYLYYDAAGELLYVGKAKHLRKRVSSYFSGTKKSQRIQLMVSKIARIETRIVQSEMEALILENNLIKSCAPKFNVLLRDDKTFLYLRITKDPVPRIMVTRRIVRDGSFYMGPRTNSRALRKTLRLCQQLFGIRTCRLQMTTDEDNRVTVTANPERRSLPCMDYHIRRCTGPCAGEISVTDYQQRLQQMKQFLRGDTRAVKTTLLEKMQTAVSTQAYEAAAKYRDLLQSIDDTVQRQQVEFTDGITRDFLHYARHEDPMGRNVHGVRLSFRGGKLLDQTPLRLTASADTPDEEIITQCLLQFYAAVDELPRELYVPALPEDNEALLDYLQQVTGTPYRCHLHVPQKGEKRRILELAQRNAAHAAEKDAIEQQSHSQVFSRAVPSLTAALGLDTPPRRIECYDISHLGGTHTVASQVVFLDGEPQKSQYRRYKIQSLTEGQIDDYQAMYEVLSRRFARLEDRGGSFADRTPDLIVIDGGAGQLSRVLDAVRDYGASHPFPEGFNPAEQIIALAKQEEAIYRVGEREPLILGTDHPAVQLLQRVRDEAHRFALSYNRNLRAKAQVKSQLDAVPGIGPQTKKKLLQRFGSVRGVRVAEETALREILTEKQLESLRQML